MGERHEYDGGDSHTPDVMTIDIMGKMVPHFRLKHVHFSRYQCPGCGHQEMVMALADDDVGFFVAVHKCDAQKFAGAMQRVAELLPGPKGCV